MVNFENQFNVKFPCMPTSRFVLAVLTVTPLCSIGLHRTFIFPLIVLDKVSTQVGETSLFMFALSDVDASKLCSP